MSSHWLSSASHEYWLRSEELRLLGFGHKVVRPDGLAAWLDDDGEPDPAHPTQTWVTARMAHVHYLGALRGVPGAMDIAKRLMVGLRDVARDSVHGGWNETQPGGTEDKAAYTHAFVILASSTGTVAGDEVARGVLTDVLELVDTRFWEPDAGRFADTWSSDWSERRTYRGINANMHLVEAMLAASDATGDPKWAQRAVGICAFVIDQASSNGWRIPEHYDENWNRDLEFNRDHPADQFKPYGATVGHAFEWSRLIAQAAPLSEKPSAFLDAAEALIERGVADGWERDGAPGFVYTTDWDGTPIVSDRLHWVVAEAIAAAAVLARVTGREIHARHYEEWWDYAATYLLDRERGSWRHQLDAHNRPSSTVWAGKPDIYHAYQAVLISQLPATTSLAEAVRKYESGENGSRL